jgi:hypothetical protein
MAKLLELYAKTPEVFVRDINAHLGGKVLDLVEVPPDLGFQLDVTVDDKMYDAIDKDGRLHQDMLDSISRSGEYEKLVQAMVWTFTHANEQVRANMLEPDRALREGLELGNKVVAEASAAMCKTAKQAYDKHFANQKAYLAYGASIVAKLTIGTISLATNIALLATTPFSFGASTVIGAVGMAKTCAVLAKTVLDTVKDAEAVFTEVMTIYVKLTDEHKRAHNPLPLKVELYTAELVNGIVGAVLSIEPLSSLKKLSDRLELAHKKVLGIDSQLSGISKAITRQIKRQEEYDALLKKAPGGSPAAQKKIAATANKLQLSEVRLAQLLEKCDHLTERYKALVKIGEMYEEWVKALLDEHRDVKLFAKVMTLLGTAYDIGTAFAGFSTDVTAITGIIANVELIVADQAAEKAFDAMAKH